MTARPCPFCGARADSREHVLPRWLLSRWPGPAPFTVEINGAPLLNRDDKLVKSGCMPRVMLPICKTCNGVLDTRFEKTAKPYVRAALDDLQALDAEATAAFARWMTKTVLLARHPETEHTAFAARTGDAKNRCDPWTPFPTAALTALLHGEILDDLSLWVAVVDVKASPVQVPAFKRIFLNTTFRDDGAGGTGNAALQGFSLADGRMAVFQLVFHPLQDFEHPFEATRLITRLWPEPPTELDLATHPVLDPDAYSALGRVFVCGGGGIGLQPGERLSAQRPWPWDAPKPDDWPAYPGG